MKKNHPLHFLDQRTFGIMEGWGPIHIGPPWAPAACGRPSGHPCRCERCSGVETQALLRLLVLFQMILAISLIVALIKGDVG